MKPTPTTIATLGLLALLPTTAVGQDAADAVRQWLWSSCTLDASPAPEILMQSMGPAATTPLLEAIDRGPHPDQIAAFRLLLEARFTRRQTVLREGRTGLPADLVAEALAVEFADYLAGELGDFDLRYRGQAVRGLGVVGDTAARRALRRIAADTASVVRGDAVAALRRLDDAR